MADFDLLFRNCTVIDGTNLPAFPADVAVKDGYICAVGPIPPSVSAARTIDASGKLLIPGIIDSHSHHDAVMFLPSCKFARITQGITTEVVGYCGPSLAPYREDRSDLLQTIFYSLSDTGYTFPWRWNSVKELFSYMEASGLASNTASFIGHGTLRTLVMGHENRKATPRELDIMKGILSDSIDEGALGLALGLSYVPGAFCDQEELRALATVLARKDAILAAHRRDEGNTAREAAQEILTISQETGVKTMICHVKATGRKNWGKTAEIISDIEAVRAKGVDVRFDVYPYPSGCINLHYIFPSWVQSGSNADMMARLQDPNIRRKVIEDCYDPEKMARSLYTYATPQNIEIIACAQEEYRNHTLAEIAEMRSQRPIECAVDLILESGDKVTMVPTMQSPEELASVIRHPLSMICSDGFPNITGIQHPRYIGTFTHVLDHYVKQAGLLSREEAVRKMTSATADFFRLKKRCRIREGYHADLVLLDWEALQDNATTSHPTAGADGILATVLNGELVAENGAATGACAGKVLLSM